MSPLNFLTTSCRHLCLKNNKCQHHTSKTSMVIMECAKNICGHLKVTFGHAVVIEN